jgi:hypothetical protein
MKKPLSFTVTAITFTLGALSFGTGCASEVPEEPASDSSQDALSAGECKAVVGKSMADFKKKCDGYAVLASTASQRASAAFSGVGPALNALEATLSRENSAFGNVLSICKAKATCDTSAFRQAAQEAGYTEGDTKPASCYVAEAVNKALCYVDAVPALVSRASSPTVQNEISSDLAALRSSLKLKEFAMTLVSGKVAEAKHAVCSAPVAEKLEYDRLFAICRSDCGDGKHTLGNAGLNRACAPAGFPQDVKCGVMKRTGLSCECVEGGVLGFGNKCRDYEILESQKGSACPSNPAQKIADVKWVNDAPAYTCK